MDPAGAERSCASGLQDDACATAGADPVAQFVGGLPALGWKADFSEPVIVQSA